MYGWILEADICRYERALAAGAEGAERIRLIGLLDRTRRRLAAARTAASAPLSGNHPAPTDAGAMQT